jgi:hypothetical protein
MKPYFSAIQPSAGLRVIVVGKVAAPSQEEGQIDWAAAEHGASRTQDSKGAVVSWSQPRLVSQVVLPLKQWLGSLEWWDGNQLETN